MTTRIRPLLVTVTVLHIIARSTSADPPAAQVLLLDNQHVLQGTVERSNGQYRVRRDGGETVVPVARVLAVCPDLDAAYRILRDKVGPSDADARLRLARWCDANGLRVQAAAEAKLASDVAPNSTIVQAVYQQLQRKADAPAPRPVEPAKLPASILDAPTEPTECTPEAFKRFATKVQPVLMNTCASCHAAEHAVKFRLERVYSDSLNARLATQRNLIAALALIDRAKPAASLLLQQATTAHGGAATPPLRDRGVPAFKQIDEWVKMAVDGVPPSPAAPTKVVKASTATPAGDAESEFGIGTPKKNVPAAPIDPFDPAIFNQRHHPDGPKRVEPPTGATPQAH